MWVRDLNLADAVPEYAIEMALTRCGEAGHNPTLAFYP